MGRPLNQFNHEDPTLFQLSASYAFGLIKNHPFVEGNKRIAFTTAVLFLERNGRKFNASEVDAVLNTLALAAGDLKEGEYANWIEANSE